MIEDNDTELTNIDTGDYFDVFEDINLGLGFFHPGNWVDADLPTIIMAPETVQSLIHVQDYSLIWIDRSTLGLLM